jgi:enoyl-CoA hydratase
MNSKSQFQVELTIHKNGSHTVGFLEFCEPEVRNAFTLPLIEGLEDQVKKALQMAQQRQLQFLVIQGKGPVFSTGLHLHPELVSKPDLMIDTVDRLNQLFARIERLPLITLAGIQGPALGAGFELALCCDVRVSSETGEFGLTDIHLGMTPGLGGSYRLLRHLPDAAVKQLILSGLALTAREAEEMGLTLVMTECTPHRILEYLDTTFGRTPFFSLIQAKRLVEAYRHHRESHFDQLERSHFLNSLYCLDRVEAQLAFLESRLPKFTGDEAWIPKS